jgi:hypothetical protein
MAPRADSLADLRALDRQLAEVAPGPHLERRILGQIRGEVDPARGRGIARARRPARVLSFGLVAAVAVVLGIEARDGKNTIHGPPASAAGPNAPEARDFEDADPAVDPEEPMAPIGPARKVAHQRPPRSIEERGDERRRAPEEVRPDSRQRVRRQAPRLFEAPETPPHFVPVAPEGGPRGETPQSTPRGLSPINGYGSMLYPQSPRAEGQEPRSIRLFGPRRSIDSGASEPDAPSPNESPPAIPWEAPDEAPSTCESYTTWKTIAHAECEAKGLALMDLKLLDECGEGMFGGVDAVCVAPAQEEDPQPGYCVGLPVGDGTTCQLPEYWKGVAEKTCSAEGLVLTDIYPHQDCSDGLSTMAKALCCGDAAPADPSPPPPPCVTFEMAPACSPVSAVEAEAKVQCAGKGLLVSDMKIIPDCPNGGVSYAAVLCCP